MSHLIRDGVKRQGGGQRLVSKNTMLKTADMDRLVNDAWLGLDLRDEDIYNPLEIIPRAMEEESHLFISWMMSRPEYISMFCKEIMNVHLFPMQALTIQEMWHHRFPLLVASRGFSKSFGLAVYGLLRATFIQGRQILVVGSAFRQSKIIFNYMETIYRNAPLFRDMVSNGKRDDQIMVHDSSMWTFRVGESKIMCIPMGTGETIRGLRAQEIYSDETSSINRHIFENVVAGFGVVSFNPVENMKRIAEKKKKIELEIEFDDDTESGLHNQIVLSGTAYYRFNHFYEYFSKYRDIIRSMGDKEKLRKVVGDEVNNPAFNWKDYCIIRIPYNLLPEGYIDGAQVSRSKVSITASNFLCEYEACFATDSDGFFRRSMIEGCVPNEHNEIRINGGPAIEFDVRLEGNPHSRFVIGVDPASENDNCAIFIVEIRDDHKRIVYGWTTTKKQFRRNLSINHIQEDNYWAFVVRKIRDLMKRFPTCAIAIDSGGGGNYILEGLHDKDKLEIGEVPVWPILNQPKHEWCDTQEGLHIVHMINFADNKWLSEAYFSTKKDMEERLLIFPNFDSASIGLIELQDESDRPKFIVGGLVDTEEQIIDEIEELKNELTCIIHGKSPTGKDQFTVPETKSAEGKKIRVKKDRATALVLANSVARSIMRDFVDSHYESNGGFATPSKNTGGSMYSNPWYSNAVSDAYEAYT